MSIFNTRLSPVFATNIVASSELSASPFAPKGGKPAVASNGSCATVATAQGVGQVATFAILKMAP